MAEIRVKRVASMSPAYLKAGELGVAGDYLYFGRYQAGDSTLSATKIALQDTSNNVFTNVNTFKYSNDGANAMEFQDADGTTKYYLKAGRLSTDLTSFNNADLVNKLYVDGLVQGLDIKASVRLASTVPLGTLTGLLTVDSVITVAGDRILVKNQATASQNGIYVVAAGPWTRAADANTGTKLISAFVFVEQGTSLADTGWVCTNNSITEWSTSITWSQFSGAGTYNAGTGLTLSGSIFSLAQIGTLTALANITAGTATPSAVAILDSTSASAIGTNQSLVTERDIYYGLPTINNSHAYNSSTTIYAPIAGGTASWILIGAGTQAAPTWTNYGTLTISTGLTAAGNYTPGGSQTITLTDIAAGGTTVGAIRYLGTSATASGKFDSSSTFPTATTRLNYQGELWATAFRTPNLYLFNAGYAGQINITTLTSGTSTNAIIPSIGGSDHYFIMANGVTTTVGRLPLSTSLSGVAAWSSTSIGTMAYEDSSSYATTAHVQSATLGGTGQTTVTTGDILYGSGTNTWSKLPANTTTIAKYLRSISSGTPTWGQIAYSELSGTPSIPTGFTISASSDVLYATGGTNTTAYNATTARTANRFYRHADMPVTSSTASALKYDGVLYAYQFEGIIDGGVWGA